MHHLVRTSLLLLLGCAGPLAAARGALALDFHVDATRGDDARPPLVAQSPATPWKTIGHALRHVTAGHRIVVAPGTYREGAETRHPGVTVVAVPAGGAIVEPPPGVSGFDVQHDGVVVDGFVIRSAHQGVLVARSKVSTPIGGVVLRNLVVEPPTGGAIATNGIHVRDAAGVIVEGNVVRGAEQQGILLKRVSHGYVRNNLVHGNPNDWGISVDGDSPSRHAPSVGNVAAFNTVWGNARGLRFRNASGEIRDNVVSENELVGIRYDQPGALFAVHHNDAWGSDANYELPSGVRRHPTNLSIAPGLVDPEGGDFSLRQLAGETPASALIDAGSGPVTTRDIDGSTASDGRPDVGVADPGFHSGAGATTGIPEIVPAADPEIGAVHYVDCAAGRDTRSKLQARNPATPWKTILRAAQELSPTQVVVVKAGTCAEAVETGGPGVAFHAEAPGAVVLEPPAGKIGFNVQHDDVVVDGFVIRSAHQGVLVAKSKAGTKLESAVLRNLVVEPPAGTRIATNGVQVRDAVQVTIESSVVRDAAQQGILLKRVSHGYVRNNLVYGHVNDWGISFDGDSPNRHEPSVGNVAAFNTVWGNRSGIRFRNASGEVRDNVVSQNATFGIRYDQPDAAWAVHHNDAWGSSVDYELPRGVWAATSNLSVDPGLVDPSAGNFALRQLPGEEPSSPLVDRGSADVTDAEIDGSTRSDGAPDRGRADLGYHAGAGPAARRPDALLPPEEEIGVVHYVDCARGDDERSVAEARDPATPWRTIARALPMLAPTQVLEVAPGVCREGVRTVGPGVTLRAAQPGSVVLEPPAAGPALRIRHDGVTVQGFVVRTPARGVLAKPMRGASLRRLILRDLRIEPAGGAPPKVAIVVQKAEHVTIEGVVATAARAGIVLERTNHAYVRNNLVRSAAAQWAIDVHGGAKKAKPRIGNVAAFNTVFGGSRGIRFRNARGEIRDNVVAGTAIAGISYDQPDGASAVHHNDVWGSASPYQLPRSSGTSPTNLTVDPGFVAPHAGSFALRQLDGEGPRSPLVDAGSAPVAAHDVDGSTASDGRPDTGVVDMGYHAGAAPSRGAPGNGGPVVAPDVPPGDAPAQYVDCATGDDRRSREESRSPATPWRTLERAALASAPGDVVVVRPGTCAGSVETSGPGMTFRAALPGSVVVEPPPGRSGFTVQHDDVVLDGFVIRSAHQGVLAAKPKSGDVLRGLVLRNLVVEPPAGGRIATNGVQVRDAEDVLVEGCVVRGAEQQGILLRRVGRGYVRNNLVHGQPNDWGISFDGDGASAERPADGNVAAFNTVWGNLRGLRFKNASGEVRDNVVSENALAGIKYDAPDAAWAVHHNDAWRSQVNYDLPSGVRVHPTNLSVDPGLVAPTSGNFALRQLAGELPASVLIDRGSGPVETRDIDGSTASDGRPDTGVADPGFHAGASASAFVPEPAPPADPEIGAVHWVDCATGDDARTKAEARNPATPWRTIGRAARLLGETQVVLVRPGVCAEAVETSSAGVTFAATQPGTVVVEPPAGATGFDVQHDDVVVDGFVVRSSHQGVLVARSKALTTIANVVLRGLVVEPPAGGTIATNGIQVRDAVRVTVEDSVVRGAARQGILLKRVSHGYVRNNLVHGNPNDWGISVDGDSPNRHAPSVGNVAAFNTVWGNLRGIRFRNALGEIRDNVASENALVGIKYDQPDASSAVHHNDAWGSGIDYELPRGLFPSTTNLSLDPRLVDPAGGNFALRQLPHEGAASPLVDRGSGAVEERDITGSTRSDGVVDAGVADMGHHAGADGSAAPPGGDGPTWGDGGPPPAARPQPGSGASYYVDPSAGDDARHPSGAQSEAGAWRTIARALAAAAPGDTVVLLPGVYAEAADFNRDALTLRGAGALGDVVLEPPPGRAGILIDGLADARVSNLVVRGAAQGIVVRGARGVHVHGVAVVESGSNGISVTDAEEVWIDGSIVTGSGEMGVKIKRSQPVYVHNNLVYVNADWGISIDGSDHAGALPPTSDNVVSFNTVHGNRAGIRLLHASGEVRDNLLAEQVDVGLYLAAPNVTVHHNVFAENGRNRDQKQEYLDTIALWGNLGHAPRYVDPAGPDGVLGGDGWRDDDFRLAQTAAGDALQSRLVDAGSDEASVLGVTGSTARDGRPDAGRADLGFHYGSQPATFVPPPVPIGTNLQSTFYVDGTLGDDGRSRQSARNPLTPWRTIAYALGKVVPGDTVVVAAGTYAETAQIETQGVQLVAETPGAVILTPPAGNGVTIEAPDATVDGFVVQGASTGVSVLPGAHRATIRNCAAYDSVTDGIRTNAVDGVIVQDSIVARSGQSGVRFKRTAGVEVSNVLVYDSGDWGIALDDSGGGRPVSTGHRIAHATLARNATGNLLLRNASGYVRDSLIVGSPGRGVRVAAPDAVLRHNGFAGNVIPMDPPGWFMTCASCTANVPLDPSFVDAGAGDFRLHDGSAGAPRSEAIDAGSGSVESVGLLGTTSVSGALDEGVVDLGFHWGTSSRALPPP